MDNNVSKQTEKQNEAQTFWNQEISWKLSCLIMFCTQDLCVFALVTSINIVMHSKLYTGFVYIIILLNKSPVLFLWMSWYYDNTSIEYDISKYNLYLLFEPLMPNLSSGFPLVTPPNFLSTINAVTLSTFSPWERNISKLTNQKNASKQIFM